MADLRLRREEETRWDLVSLGEVMMRLDPGDIPFSRARTCRLWHGGGETNVAEGAASTFGLRAAIVTALVDDPIGRLIERQVMEAGVDTGLIKWWMPGGDGEFATDAKGSLHNGINVTFAGKGVLPSTTDYYRAHTPIREFCQEQMDWDEIFGGHGMGARWFSTGGIYTLLSEKTAEMAQVAMAKAGTYGVMRSYDLNYRSKVQPDKSLARSLNHSVLPNVDFLVGNQKDFCDALNFQCEVDEAAPLDEWLGSYQDMLRLVARQYANLKLIGTQLRGARTADTIDWAGVLYDCAEDKMYQAPIRENVEIADRTGGGDSFASGVIAAVLSGENLQTAVEWGTAHGLLVQCTPGDTTLVDKRAVLAEVKRASSSGGVSALR